MPANARIKVVYDPRYTDPWDAKVYEGDTEIISVTLCPTREAAIEEATRRYREYVYAGGKREEWIDL